MTPHPQPAAKPKRRWFQFSLRTLLIGTAVVGAFLGVMLRWIAPAQRQRAAVLIVERLGGKVEYEKAAPGESWFAHKLRRWLPRYFFDAVVTLYFRSAVADKDLLCLSRFKQLEGVCLIGTEATDAGVRYLSELERLTYVELDGTRITDVGLAHLSGLTQLQCLTLDCTEISDAGLQAAKKPLKIKSQCVTRRLP